MHNQATFEFYSTFELKIFGYQTTTINEGDVPMDVDEPDVPMEVDEPDFQ